MNSRKWHYFVDRQSLCGKWAVFSDDDLETGSDDSPDNCAVCKRKLAKSKLRRVKKRKQIKEDLENDV